MSPHKSIKSLELVVLGLLAALIVALAFPLIKGVPSQQVSQDAVEVLNP